MNAVRDYTVSYRRFEAWADERGGLEWRPAADETMHTRAYDAADAATQVKMVAEHRGDTIQIIGVEPHAAEDTALLQRLCDQIRQNRGGSMTTMRSALGLSTDGRQP